jgi:hypothetical protein
MMIYVLVADNGEIGVPIRLLKGPDGSLNMFRVNICFSLKYFTGKMVFRDQTVSW